MLSVTPGSNNSGTLRMGPAIAGAEESLSGMTGIRQSFPSRWGGLQSHSIEPAWVAGVLGVALCKDRGWIKSATGPAALDSPSGSRSSPPPRPASCDSSLRSKSPLRAQADYIAWDPCPDWKPRYRVTLQSSWYCVSIWTVAENTARSQHGGRRRLQYRSIGFEHQLS